MASPMSSSSLLFLTLLFINIGLEAREHLVGGSTNASKVPSSTSESLNQWAGATRFQVGDSLVWKYDGEKDSVLQVRREGYLNLQHIEPDSIAQGWGHSGEAPSVRAILFHQWHRGRLQEGGESDRRGDVGEVCASSDLSRTFSR